MIFKNSYRVLDFNDINPLAAYSIKVDGNCTSLDLDFLPKELYPDLFRTEFSYEDAVKTVKFLAYINYSCSFYNATVTKSSNQLLLKFNDRLIQEDFLNSFIKLRGKVQVKFDKRKHVCFINEVRADLERLKLNFKDKVATVICPFSSDNFKENLFKKIISKYKFSISQIRKLKEIYDVIRSGRTEAAEYISCSDLEELYIHLEVKMIEEKNEAKKKIINFDKTYELINNRLRSKRIKALECCKNRLGREIIVIYKNKYLACRACYKCKYSKSDIFDFSHRPDKCKFDRRVPINKDQISKRRVNFLPNVRKKIIKRDKYCIVCFFNKEKINKYELEAGQYELEAGHLCSALLHDEGSVLTEKDGIALCKTHNKQNGSKNFIDVFNQPPIIEYCKQCELNIYG